MEAEAAVIREREGGALKGTGTFSGRGSVGADDWDEDVTDKGVVEQGRADGGGRGSELASQWDGMVYLAQCRRRRSLPCVEISNLLASRYRAYTQDRQGCRAA